MTFPWDLIWQSALYGLVAGLAAAVSNVKRRPKMRIYLKPLRPIPELFVHEN